MTANIRGQEFQLRSREGEILVAFPPPLAIGELLSARRGSRILLLFSGVIRDGLSTTVVADNPKWFSRGQYSPKLMTALF